MFSINGKKTTCHYIAFQQDDPVQAEKRITKRLAQKRTDFTAGIIAGLPASQEQIEKFKQITMELENEALKFRRRLYKNEREERERQ